MMLTTKGRYAVMAMVDLAYYRQDSKAVALHEISGRQAIGLSYLEQLFNKLKRGNLVEAIKGPGGGYILSKAAKDISILSIITAVDESVKITRCDINKHGCLNNNQQICFTHSLWAGLGTQISSYLDSISLQDVCRNISK